MHAVLFLPWSFNTRAGLWVWDKAELFVNSFETNSTCCRHVCHVYKSGMKSYLAINHIPILKASHRRVKYRVREFVFLWPAAITGYSVLKRQK